MKTIAIIPARGGSKGIPRKNKRIIAGKPLVVHSIEHAHKSKLIDRIIVSTDDEEISIISKNAGAEVIIRPPELAKDNSPSEDALLHTIQTLHDDNYFPDIIVFLQPTSPIRSIDDIDNALNLFLENDADSLLSVTQFHHFIWEQREKNMIAINYNPKNRKMRQNLTPQYQENGSMYIFRTDLLLKTSCRLGGKIIPYVMDSLKSFEIDDFNDLWLCEQILIRENKKELIKKIPNSIELIVFDFDGVFTDNKVIVSEKGIESVICDRSDGYGIELLRKNGFKLLVLSKETNPVVKARCDKLGIPLIYNCQNKKSLLCDYLNEHSINNNNVIYVGNDLNDYECMITVGCSVAPSDAHPVIKSISRIILNHPGGNGAIRELSEILIEKENI